MTGWRLGWLAAPEAVAKAAGSLQGQQTSNATSISQYAALAALRGPQDCVEEMRAEFERRRDFIIPALAEVPGVKIGSPGGAFYAFPEISAHLDGRLTYRGEPVTEDMQLAVYLLEEALISVVPGSAFGADGYLRFSFATSLDRITEGVRRFTAALTG
jgi:aspartate aminotransferase